MKKVLAVFLIACCVQVYGMEPLSEQDMAFVIGQDGIALDMEYRMNLDAAGNPVASCDESVVQKRCYIALEFANRTDAWVVLKGTYYQLNLYDLQIDGSEMDTSPSDNRDLTRFEDEDGNCILAGCDPSGLPALALTYPDDHATFTTNFGLYLYVPRLAVEFGPQGFQADSNGSVLGLRVSDYNVAGPSPQARFDVDGRVSVYGF